MGPDQTPHYAVSHLGSHCFYICSVYEMLCSNRLDGYDVSTNVANYDIQSAKSADPDQMPYYAESHLGSHSLHYVPFMGYSAISANSAGPDQRPHVLRMALGINIKYYRFLCCVIQLLLLFFKILVCRNLSPEETRIQQNPVFSRKVNY